MIIGVGTDLVGVPRFAASLERTPRMRDKLFTPAEAELSIESLAARFAAKEALAKALGAPPGMGWHDAEVVKDADGRPVFELRGTVAARAEELGVTRVHLSLTHDADLASATVVLES
jgi:holo-[acyl-carrier protein] synthase